MTRRSNAGHRTSDEGFTLIEIVVAVTLVAMMAVSLWAVFRISVRSWRQGTEFMDTNQRHRTILDLVKKQMASVCGVLVPADPALGMGAGVHPVFAGAESSVQFISLNSLRFQENPGLTMVSYDVVEDRRGDYSLVEREERYLGPDSSLESTANGAEAKTTTIFENLTSFMFEYFDPGTRERPAQWVKDWDAVETGTLPAAISMTMISRDPKGRIFNRHMVVPVMAEPFDPRRNFVNPFVAPAPQVRR